MAQTLADFKVVLVFVEATHSQVLSVAGKGLYRLCGGEVELGMASLLPAVARLFCPSGLSHL